MALTALVTEGLEIVFSDVTRIVRSSLQPRLAEPSEFRKKGPSQYEMLAGVVTTALLSHWRDAELPGAGGSHTGVCLSQRLYFDLF